MCTKKRPCEKAELSCLQHISTREKKNNQATYDSLILKLWPSELWENMFWLPGQFVLLLLEESAQSTHMHTQRHTHTYRGEREEIKEWGGRGEEERRGGREEGMEGDRKRIHTLYNDIVVIVGL